MADYNLPQYVVSRVRYYDGEYLKDDEFIDEQKYHIDRRQRHDRLLHVAGVCEGLVPSAVNATTIKVTAGTAIDDQGRTILVESDRTITVKSDQSGALDIVITFAEKEDRLADGNSGVRSYTRFTQDPVLQLSASAVARGVVIGQAVIAPGSLQVTRAKRVYSGLRLPGPSGAAYALRSRGGDAAPGFVDLECSLNVTGSQTVAGSLAVGASDPSGNKLRVSGNTLLGGDVQVTGSQTVAGSLAVGASDPSGIKLRVSGNTLFGGEVQVSGKAALGGELQVTGKAALGGELQVTGKATFSDGAVAKGLNLGTSGATTTYTYPYESIGTDSANHNLRLLSSRSIYAHAAKGLIVSKEQGGSGDATVEGALTVNGDANIKGGTLTLGEWTLEGDGDYLYIKRGSSTVARFGTDRDKIRIYKNNNGTTPFFYYNDENKYGTNSG